MSDNITNYMISRSPQQLVNSGTSVAYMKSKEEGWCWTGSNCNHQYGRKNLWKTIVPI